MYVLDTEAWSWWRAELSAPLPPLAYHTASLSGDKVFLFGGSTKEALCRGTSHRERPPASPTTRHDATRRDTTRHEGDDTTRHEATRSATDAT